MPSNRRNKRATADRFPANYASNFWATAIQFVEFGSVAANTKSNMEKAAGDMSIPGPVGDPTA